MSRPEDIREVLSGDPRLLHAGEANHMLLPFVGPSGSMIDYGTLTTDRVVYRQNAPVYVLARADSPDTITQQLRDRGLSVSTTLDDVERTLDQGAYASPWAAAFSLNRFDDPDVGYFFSPDKRLLFLFVEPRRQEGDFGENRLRGGEELTTVAKGLALRALEQG